jgi:hypothetical protein
MESSSTVSTTASGWVREGTGQRCQRKVGITSGYLPQHVVRSGRIARKFDRQLSPGENPSQTGDEIR